MTHGAAILAVLTTWGVAAVVFVVLVYCGSGEPKDPKGER